MREIDENERAQLKAIRSALISVGVDLSLPQLVALLTVSLEPGLSVNELAERMGTPQQSASRYSSVLLGRYQSTLEARPREPLISQGVNAQDPRKRALFLTREGHDLVTNMSQAMIVRTGKNVTE